jgi:hypothetical protein
MSHTHASWFTTQNGPLAAALQAAHGDWQDCTLELDSRETLISKVLLAVMHTDELGRASKVASLRMQLAELQFRERLPANMIYLEALINALNQLPADMRSGTARDTLAAMKRLRQRFIAVSRELADDHRRRNESARWQGSDCTEKAPPLQLILSSLNEQLMRLQADLAPGGG